VTGLQAGDFFLISYQPPSVGLLYFPRVAGVFRPLADLWIAAAPLPHLVVLLKRQLHRNRAGLFSGFRVSVPYTLKI
jgi:hypothetical protein